MKSHSLEEKASQGQYCLKQKCHSKDLLNMNKLSFQFLFCFTLLLAET